MEFLPQIPQGASSFQTSKFFIGNYKKSNNSVKNCSVVDDRLEKHIKYADGYNNYAGR
jgi:hypothetical protein